MRHVVESLVGRVLVGIVEHLLDALHGERRVGRDLGGRGARAFEHAVLIGIHAVDQAGCQRAVGAEKPTGKRHLSRHALAHDGCYALQGAHVGDDGYLCFEYRELRVLGERGLFKLDYLTQQLTFFPSSAEPPASANGIAIDIDKQEPLRAELASFVRVARREETPRVGAGDAIAAMRVVEALVESAQRGEAVAISAADSA